MTVLQTVSEATLPTDDKRQDDVSSDEREYKVESAGQVNANTTKDAAVETLIKESKKKPINIDAKSNPSCWDEMLLTQRTFANDIIAYEFLDMEVAMIAEKVFQDFEFTADEANVARYWIFYVKSTFHDRPLLPIELKDLRVKLSVLEYLLPDSPLKDAKFLRVSYFTDPAAGRNHVATVFMKQVSELHDKDIIAEGIRAGNALKESIRYSRKRIIAVQKRQLKKVNKQRANLV